MIRSFVRRLFQLFYRLYAVRANVRVGRNVHIGIGSILWAPHGLQVFDDAYIGKFCTIECDGQIGRASMIANNVGLIGRYDHDHRCVGKLIRHSPWIGDIAYSGPGRDLLLIVEEDVWVGFGAIVLSGVTVGRGAIVAAGSVVIHDVPPYSIVAGNPARVVGERFSPDQIAAHEQILADES